MTHSAPSLAKSKRERLDTGIEEFNLKDRVLDRLLLTDELIHPGLSNLPCAIGRGIGSMILAGRGTIHRYFEANGRPVFLGTQNHMEVARMEPEYNLARRRLERGALGADVPRSAETPLI